MNYVLLLHGPNLNLLGQRDQQHYGRITLLQLEQVVAKALREHDLGCRSFQSNWEGRLIDCLQSAGDDCVGAIVNLGALSHYSYALHDAILDCHFPAIEVHLSHISEREPWRQTSVIAPACVAQIENMKEAGYIQAVSLLTEHLAHVT